MKTVIFNGIESAARIRNKLKADIAEVKSFLKRSPKLVSIMAGDNYSSKVYSKMQRKETERLGIDFECVKLQSDITEEELVNRIKILNKNNSVDGIFVHQPLPETISVGRIRESVLEFKDVECEHYKNMGKLFNDNFSLIPPTPSAIFFAIQDSGISLKGKEVVIIGHSSIVGKPTALLLLDRLATVTVTHIGTYEAQKLYQHTRRADILISAVGKNNLVKKDSIKKGAVVIDVGINSGENGVSGDVDYEQILGKAGFVTPVPGGIGPLTVMFLMKNLITLCKSR